jgi:urease accessory protein
MYDAALRYDVELPQRARGELRLGFRRRGAATVLAELYQQGTLKARLPRPEPDAMTTAVTLNTAGGITAGDVLESRITWHAGAAATVAAQSAERLYRADLASPPARIATTLDLHEGAHGEWLPQETILFDAGRTHRRLSVNLAGNARFLGVECLVFGRAAMGETIRTVQFHDRWSFSREGRLVLDERVRLNGSVAATLARGPVAGGACGVATIIQVAPDAEAGLEAVRDALATAPGEAAASAWNGALVVRVLAAHSTALRATVLAALAPLREGRAVPKVWQC